MMADSKKIMPRNENNQSSSKELFLTRQIEEEIGENE